MICNLRQCTRTLWIRETVLEVLTRCYYTPFRLHTVSRNLYCSLLVLRLPEILSSHLLKLWEIEAHLSQNLYNYSSQSLTHLTSQKSWFIQYVAMLWVITLNWKTPFIHFSQIKDRVDAVMLTERIFHAVSDSMPQFSAKWNIWSSIKTVSLDWFTMYYDFLCTLYCLMYYLSCVACFMKTFLCLF